MGMFNTELKKAELLDTNNLKGWILRLTFEKSGEEVVYKYHTNDGSKFSNYNDTDELFYLFNSELEAIWDCIENTISCNVVTCSEIEDFTGYKFFMDEGRVIKSKEGKVKEPKYAFVTYAGESRKGGTSYWSTVTNENPMEFLNGHYKSEQEGHDLFHSFYIIAWVPITEEEYKQNEDNEW